MFSPNSTLISVFTKIVGYILRKFLKASLLLTFLAFFLRLPYFYSQKIFLRFAFFLFITPLIIPILIASDGRSGIEYTLNKKYDLIFMDLLLPKLNGHDATNIIRNSKENLNNATPIVAISAISNKDDREKCFEIGMQEFLTKPFDFNSLKKIVYKYRLV